MTKNATRLRTTEKICRLAKRLRHLFSFNTLYVLFYLIRNFFTHDVIFTRSWVKRKKFETVLPYNWGDELNKYFIEFITGRKVVLMDSSLPIKHYSMIGSVLSFYNQYKAVVYGSGLIEGSQKVRGTPEKIISVRGPLTRQALIQKGFDCPEKYGDPAMLLPVFYSPSRKKQNHMLAIPHWRTYAHNRNNAPMTELQEKYHCRVITMTAYDKWTDIIDEIAGSDFVMSESLHGVIVSETYNVPCLWVEFSDHRTGFFHTSLDWSFKFRDFYESIGKHNMSSMKLYEGFNFDDILRAKDKWRPGKIDYAELLSLFPFEIKPEFLPRIKKFLQGS